MDAQIDYKKLKDSRVDKDLTQKELGARLNISQSAYNKLERGKTGIRVEQIKKISEVLDKDLSELLKTNSEIKKNGTKKSMEKEVDILESILYKISVEIETDLITEIHHKSRDYYQPLSFQEFLVDGINDRMFAIEQIKQEIEDYKTSKNYYPFYDLLGENGIENLINKDDKWLFDFVSQEENYEFVFTIMCLPHYLSIENEYLGFKKVIKENIFAKYLLSSGLMENSCHIKFWERYLKESGGNMNSFNKKDEANEKNIKLKLKNILLNREKLNRSGNLASDYDEIPF